VRRPSPSLVVAFLALLVALGGVGYAATSFRVQARVTGTCLSGNAAISAIDAHGNVTCLSTRPQEVDTATGSPVLLGDAPTAVAAETLSGHLPNLVLAAPAVQIAGGAGVDQHVVVSCMLAASPITGYAQTRSGSFDLSSAHESESGSIPLLITEPGGSGPVTVAVSCSSTVTGGGTAPTVDVSTTINALQTGGNVTQTPTTATTTTATTG
jgi:hypothetical protein